MLGIAEHEAIVGIVEHEALRNVLDGVPQPDLRLGLGRLPLANGGDEVLQGSRHVGDFVAAVALDAHLVTGDVAFHRPLEPSQTPHHPAVDVFGDAAGADHAEKGDRRQHPGPGGQPVVHQLAALGDLLFGARDNFGGGGHQAVGEEGVLEEGRLDRALEADFRGAHGEDVALAGS